jgi:uncharacterized protein (TIGR02453 family)
MSFDALIPDARAFLGALGANNTRDWFIAHKVDYETRLKTPALHLADEIATRLSRLTGLRTTPKLFRAHRDVRFSKDKTPYHTHLHLLWTSEADGRAPPQWFFGIAPDYVSAGAGRMGFDKDTLARYRAALPTHGPALLATLEVLQSQGARLGEPELKRPAPPIAPDDPLAGLARRKSLGLWVDYTAPLTGLADRLEQDFTRLWPMQQALQNLLQG